MYGKLNFLRNGLPVSCEISGEVQVLSKLSGMPDMSLIFSNPHILDDVRYIVLYLTSIYISSFHPCVRYNRFEQNKVISFVPPDGSWEKSDNLVKPFEGGIISIKALGSVVKGKPLSIISSRSYRNINRKNRKKWENGKKYINRKK